MPSNEPPFPTIAIVASSGPEIFPSCAVTFFVKTAINAFVKDPLPGYKKETKVQKYYYP